jgi:hypothetical protein
MLNKKRGGRVERVKSRQRHRNGGSGRNNRKGVE